MVEHRPDRHSVPHFGNGGACGRAGFHSREDQRVALVEDMRFQFVRNRGTGFFPPDLFADSFDIGGDAVRFVHNEHRLSIRSPPRRKRYPTLSAFPRAICVRRL